MVDPVELSKPIVPPTTAAKPVRRKRGRWLNRGFVFLVLVGILGWFAPTIVATTELRNRLPRLLFPGFPGSIEMGETSLSWTGPILIKELRIADEDGLPLLEVGQFSTSETLWMLVTRPENVGTFKIIDAVIHVSLSDDDSNIERALERLVAGNPTKGPLPDHTVEIENARVELEHPARHRKSVVDEISIRLTLTAGTMCEFDLAIGSPPAMGGSVATTDWFAARYRSSSKDDVGQKSADERNLVVRASQWKLDRLSPLCPRFLSSAEFTGALNADSSIRLDQTENRWDWDWNGSVSVEQLLIAGLDVLKQDRLTLERVDLSGRAATTNGRLAMHDVKLVTDIGDVTATGDIPVDGDSKKSALELIRSLMSDEDYHIQGHIDLKKLAALLPQTLRIRDGIEITAGEIKVQFVGVDVAGERRWSGAAGIVGLSATKQGKTIPWDRPIAARVNAHRLDQAIVVDLLECKSEFLRVTGKGTIDDAQFTTNGDLSKLLENLERFVDLGIDQLSGQLIGNGEIRRRDDDHIEFTSKILLDDFAYVVSANNVWHEKHLELTVNSSGETDATPRLTRVNTGEVHLKSGGDTLDAVLQNPVDLAESAPVYSGIVDLKGDLATWQNRLRPFGQVGNWDFSGTVDLSTTISADSQKLDIGRLKATARSFIANGPEWLIQEPELTIETKGEWDVASRKWTSPRLSLVSNSLKAQLTDWDYASGAPGIAGLSGMAKFQGDLAQISGWKNLAIKNPSYYLVGALTGTASIKRLGGPMIGVLDTQVEKFIVAAPENGATGEPQWVAIWKEPLLKVTGNGSYDAAADRVTLDAGQVNVDGLALAFKGSLDQCQTSRRMDLTGNLAYDWDLLVKRLGPKSARNIQVTGQDQRPFSLKGSLASLSLAAGTSTANGVTASTVSFPSSSNASIDSTGDLSNKIGNLSGQIGLGWTTANLYGIKIGNGDLTLRFDRNLCQFAPIDVAVNDGRLHLTPAIPLDGKPFLLVLGQERLADQVTLSPQLCASALSYVAPMLANSAQADGKFSVDMHDALLPLSAPGTGTAHGTLMIHRAQARPGPTAQQFVSAIDQLRALISGRQPGVTSDDQIWIEMTEQQVPVKLEQGRIAHEGLTMMVRNVAVKSSGSVGLDQTLDLVAEISVKDEWVSDNLFASFKGKSIQIPIRGTISRPQIDPAFFQNLTKQIGGSVIDGLIPDQVGGNLKGVIDLGLEKVLNEKK